MTAAAMTGNARERELLLARRKAEQVAKDKADLLAMLSHDIRNPLNAVMGVVQLLDRATKGLVSIAQRQKLMEAHIKQLEDWSSAQIQAAEEAAGHWKTATAATERKLEELQRSVRAATQRAETAEATMQRDRTALAALQNRILTAFGANSAAHEAIAGLAEI